MAAQLYDEGATDILSVYFQATSAPATFYAFLGAGTRPTSDTTVMSGVTEVSGTSYARQSAARGNTDWPTVALVSGEVCVDSKQLTFTAGGTWTTYTYVGLTTALSGTAGKFIASWDVGTARALVNGESYKPTLRVQLD